MCMADLGDDRPDIYQSEIRTARKEWQCDECGRKIKPGEPYHKASMLYERHWSDWRICRHCRVAAAWLIENCGGFLHAGVLEDLYEHASEYPSIAAGILRIKVGAQRAWRRFDKAGLMPVPRMPAGISEYLREDA